MPTRQKKRLTERSDLHKSVTLRRVKQKILSSPATRYLAEHFPSSHATPRRQNSESVNMRLSRRGRGRQNEAAKVALFKDVHSQLSEHFCAYSVFRPRPEDHLPLFQVALILSSEEDRARSPKKTSANLKKIFTRLERNLASSSSSTDPSFDGNLIREFLEELTEVSVSSRSDATFNSTPTMTVTEESLLRAGVTVTAGSLATVDIGVAHMNSIVRQVRLAEIYSHAYTGGGELRRLIWNHKESVFGLILLDIDMDLGTDPGDRSLIAIITKTIHAKVGVSRNAVHGLSLGANSGHGSGAAASAGFEQSSTVSQEFDDHLGTCAVHFIVFPVEMQDRYKWRIYRGIEVCDTELQGNCADATSLKRDNFLQSRNWHLGKDTNLNHSSDYEDVEKTTQRSNMTLTSENDESSDGTLDALQYLNSQARNEENNEVEYFEVSVNCEPHPWFDIDITESLDTFAQQQYELASELLVPEGIEHEHGIKILRSSLRKCRPSSMASILQKLSECYDQGIGTEKNADVSHQLELCAKNFLTCSESCPSWLTSLENQIKNSPAVPELRLIDIQCSETELAVCTDAGTKPSHYTVFIGHAGPDKDEVAIPLYRRLREKGITAFADWELRPGDQGPREIEMAMENADIGVFITSPAFACRWWPMKGLSCFLRRREEAKAKSRKQPSILPVFYRLGVHECRNSDLFKEPAMMQEAARQSFFDADRQQKVLEYLRELTGITGIEYREFRTDSWMGRLEIRMEYRDRFLKRIVDAIVEIRDRRDEAGMQVGATPANVSLHEDERCFI